MSETFVSNGDLIGTLEELLRIYRRFEVTAHAKRHALGVGDVKALQAILQEEQQLIQNVEHLEKQRIVREKDNGEFPLTLSKEIAALKGDLQEKAKMLFAELKDLVKSVELLNKINSEVIEHVLHFIDYNVNLLLGNNSALPGYGRSGDDNRSATGLIDRKA